MPDCIRRGEAVGSLIQYCCGGREELVPLWACLSEAQTAAYCVPYGTVRGLAPVILDTRRTTAVIAGCRECPHWEDHMGKNLQQIPPEPTPMELKVQRMRDELLGKRGVKRPVPPLRQRLRRNQDSRVQPAVIESQQPVQEQ